MITVLNREEILRTQNADKFARIHNILLESHFEFSADGPDLKRKTPYEKRSLLPFGRKPVNSDFTIFVRKCDADQVRMLLCNPYRS